MHFEIPACGLLVFTDLDGTLLDQDSYAFEAAVPALERLARLAVPVIPVTSKTLAEIEVLVPSLGLNGPCIAESGGLVAIPRGYFTPPLRLQPLGPFLVEYLSPPYAEILAVLEDLRRTASFEFTGFSDLSDAEVARLTDLDAESARRARRRLCSEPLLWRDSAEARQHFSRRLRERGLSLAEGGRFLHVLGQTDKSRAIDRLKGYYRGAGLSEFETIALGDSPNDVPMLQGADTAVVVRRKDEGRLAMESRADLVRTAASGPAGWNEFFQAYLDDRATRCERRRANHG